MKNNFSRFLSFSILVGLLLAPASSTLAQTPAPTPENLPVPVDCSKFQPAPSKSNSSANSSTASPLLHRMPPHPDFEECARLGLAALPDLSLQPDLETQSAESTTQVAGPSGIYRTLAILVKFTDKPNQVSASFFDSLLFSTTSSPLRDYYDKVSYGLLDIVTVNLPSSLGWMTMPQNYGYYVGIGGTGYGYESPFPNNAQKLAADAARAANPVVNFANYDNDNDGDVDTIFIIHTGRGAEFTGSSSDIWSHSWVTNSADRPFLDGKVILSYTIEPEYWVTPGDMTVGVFAHELGHVFGLPDLYDTDGSSRGVGRWSLMAGGSWNGSYPGGNSPAFLDAWSRVKLGWSNLVTISSTQNNVSIPNATNNPTIYLVRRPGGTVNEYYLLENRQKTGYDSSLPGAGLLIWHIDDYKQSNEYECKNHFNWNCNPNHLLVALEQADGLLELENNLDSGDNGDPFPGSTNKRHFYFNTTPNTSSYFINFNPNIFITNISNSETTMTADVILGTFSPDFSKSTPANAAASQSTNPALAWTNSLSVTSYDYCIDTTAGSSCDATWVNVGKNTSVQLNNLSNGSTYYWQVRSNHAQGTTYANYGAWWSFSTVANSPPLDFTKNSPADSTTGLSTNTVISWDPSSGADSYEYCIDNSHNYTCNASWISTGTNTNASLTGLAYNSTFYWQVRAVKSGLYTYADGGAWRSFTTQTQPSFPSSFAKLAPQPGSMSQPQTPTLSWEASQGAASYEYCFDTTNDGACSTWFNVGASTSITLPTLSYDTWYYWQVRAVNASGASNADYSVFWSFQVRPLIFKLNLPLVTKS